MSPTVTVRLTKELASWLEAAAHRQGVSPARVILGCLEQVRANAAQQPFMGLAGTVAGSRNLSRRTGFSHS